MPRAAVPGLAVKMETAVPEVKRLVFRWSVQFCNYISSCPSSVSPPLRSQEWQVTESHLTSAAPHLQQLLIPPPQHSASATSCSSCSDTKLRQGSGTASQPVPTAALPAGPPVCQAGLHALLACVLIWRVGRLLGGTWQLIQHPQEPGKDPCAEIYPVTELTLQAEALQSKSMLWRARCL